MIEQESQLLQATPTPKIEKQNKQTLSKYWGDEKNLEALCILGKQIKTKVEIK